MPEVLMPRLSDTMEEGVVSRWCKQQGDMVHKGDILVEIETDKASMDLEAYDEGILTRILVDEGSTVPIGTPIAVIDATAGAATSPITAETPPTTPASTTPTARTTSAPTPARMSTPASVRATPLVRRLAREHSIDLAAIPGSGPDGRIIRADIDAVIAGQNAATPASPPAGAPPPMATPAAPPASTDRDSVEVPLTRMRRLTAQRLTQSAQQAPHFYLTRVVDADALLVFRSQLNKDLVDTGTRISVTDLLVKACAQALTTHPEVNSSWAETRLLRHHRIHIGVAVAIDDGLIVPVLHDADRKTLLELSREAHHLAERARSGRLSLDEITGSTFTISNLGTYGIDQFTAVINPPEAAILAVGAATPGPIVRDAQLTTGTTMHLTLSIDHRVLDGATAAQFLADLVTLLHHPTRIVL